MQKLSNDIRERRCPVLYPTLPVFVLGTLLPHYRTYGTLLVLLLMQRALLLVLGRLAYRH